MVKVRFEGDTTYVNTLGVEILKNAAFLFLVSICVHLIKRKLNRGISPFLILIVTRRTPDPWQPRPSRTSRG